MLRSRLNVRACKNATDYGNTCHAAAFQLLDIIRGNSADCHNRNGNACTDFRKHSVIHRLCVRLGTAAKYSSASEIIRTCRFRSLRLLDCLGSHANDLVLSKNRPCILHLHIRLSDVDAVCIDAFCKCHVIVNDERNLIRPAKLLNQLRFRLKMRLVQFLLTDLNHRRSAPQRFFDLFV